MRGHILSLLAAGCAALMMVGCAPQATNIGGKPREKVYQSAISLSPSTTEVMLRMGVTTNLVGRTDACNWPVGRINQIPSVMRGIKPNYEQITALRPDLIVLDPELFSADDLAKIKELGIDTWEFAPQNFDEWVTELYRLGAKIGNETEFSRTLDTAKNAVETATANAPATRPKVAVMLAADGAGEHLIRGTEGFLADMVKRAGGELVGPAGKSFVPTNAESLVSQNPDVIIVGGDPTPILRDPRMASVKAVQSKYVFGVSQDVLLRRGARVAELTTALNGIFRNPAEALADIERRRQAAASPLTPTTPGGAPVPAAPEPIAPSEDGGR